MKRAALLLLAATACLGQTPDDKERSTVADVGRRGPTHNPGSPCLLCHGFAIAGTIYRHAGDEAGLAGVTVSMTDDAGHAFTAVSNQTGNFYVTDGGGGSTAVLDGEGHTSIPWAVVYPVRVEIGDAGATKKMRSVIHQWGSCGECHKPDKGATSAGRIFLEDTP